MKKITQGQMKKIHALARETGMDGDLLHEYVFLLTEKESLKDLIAPPSTAWAFLHL